MRQRPHTNITNITNITVAGLMASLPASRLDVLLKSIACFTRAIETLRIETYLVLVDRDALHFTVPED